MQSWLRMRGSSTSFQLVRYEDLLSDPASELSKVAFVLGIDASSEKIDRAINLSSAKEMRSMEQKQSQQWGATKGSRRDIPFVGEARSNGWKSKLSNTSVRNIEQAWGKTLVELGYELQEVPNTL